MNYLNYIDGAWIAAQDKETLNSINPANVNEVIGYFPSSSGQDVDNATNVAKQALKGWRKLSSIDRGNYLQKTADILESRLEEIAITATKEMGKTLVECKGEVARGVAILRYYAQEGYRKTGDVIPSANSENLLYTTRVPLGVVGVITPWNFPIAIPIWKIAPALVFGNTVVFKPASETSITAVKIVEAFHEAGIPKGVLNLIQGKGSTVGDAIVSHQKINGITFTGSNQVGRKVAEIAASRGAKYQLEMGGKNPTIVLEDADLELAAELTVSATMKHTGQKCTATSRCFVQESVYEDFKSMILKKVKEIKVGNGLDSDTYMGPLASKSQLETVMSYINKGKKEGANLIFGGERLEGQEFVDGFYVEPTVFENVKNHMTIAQEEIFGPVLCLIKVSTFEEAIEQANDTNFGLAASLFTSNLAKSLTFIDEIEAGMIKINGESAGVELQAPFGGMKGSSSYSREQGQAAVEFFTITKTVTITPTN